MKIFKQAYHNEKIFSSAFDGEKTYLIGCSKAGYQDLSLIIDRSFLNSLSNNDTVKMILVEAKKYLTIELVSAEGKKLDGGIIEVRNTGTGESQTYTVNPSGAISVTLRVLSQYEITGRKPSYKSKSVAVTPAELIGLDKDTIPVVLPDANVLFEKNEIGQLIELDIRYDVNKSVIRKDAARELDRLVTFLQKNVNVKVELGSHTDIRGSEENNLKLSQSRAEAAVRYIVSKGISIERLMPVGYGETNPRVKNATNEEEHQQNRRTTVKIIGI